MAKFKEINKKPDPNDMITDYEAFEEFRKLWARVYENHKDKAADRIYEVIKQDPGFSRNWPGPVP